MPDLAEEILATLRTNGMGGTDQKGGMVIPVEKAATIVSMFVRTEVAKTQRAIRNRELLGVASQLMAGMYANSEFVPSEIPSGRTAVAAAKELLAAVAAVQETPDAG